MLLRSYLVWSWEAGGEHLASISHRGSVNMEKNVSFVTVLLLENLAQLCAIISGMGGGNMEIDASFFTVLLLEKLCANFSNKDTVTKEINAGFFRRSQSRWIYLTSLGY